MYEDVTNFKARVLVVDDEAMQRELISEALKRAGFEVDVAGDVEKAKKLIRTRPYEVLVCDIRLGNQSGLDVARFAKALDHTQEVIIITGYASIETAQEAIREEAFDYLTKPLNLSELCRVVERAAIRSKVARRNKEVLESLIKSGKVSPIFPKSRLFLEGEAEITYLDLTESLQSRLATINYQLRSLKMLWELKSSGAISDEEYERIKRKILEESS